MSDERFDEIAKRLLGMLCGRVAWSLGEMSKTAEDPEEREVCIDLGRRGVTFLIGPAVPKETVH